MRIARQNLKLEILSFLACFLTGSAFIAILPEPARAANAFEQGKEEFNLKRYHAAKAQFMVAINQNPSNQRAYLYLGRCLEYLKEPEDAQATYRACFTVNPFSEDGKRAKQYSMEIAGRMESKEHRAVDSPEHVIDSGLLIQRQSLDLQARKLREAEAYARSRRMAGRRQGYFYTPRELMRRDPRAELSNRDFIQNRTGIYDTNIESAKYRAHGHKTALSVQDTANALIERLGRKSNSSAPALRALGTNLYVQYFRSKNDEEDVPPPPDPPIELRAKQLKFTEIPKAYKAQSKIFKFPTVGPEDLLTPAKTESVEEALFRNSFKSGQKPSSSAAAATNATPKQPTVKSRIDSIKSDTDAANEGARLVEDDPDTGLPPEPADSKGGRDSVQTAPEEKTRTGESGQSNSPSNSGVQNY